MQEFLSDLKFGLRQLCKSPFFTLIAAVALGLGISSVATQLSVANGIFLKGLPFPQSDRLMHLERVNVQRDNFGEDVPLVEFNAWREQQDVFEGLAGYYVGTANLTVGDTVERYDGCFISANAFDLLKVQAYLGRALQAEDDEPDARDVVVLSHRVWEKDFGADPNILGKTGILNGRTVTVVGVMPEGFRFPVTEDLWIPLFQQQNPAELEWGKIQSSLEVIGRLKEGISPETARANMAAVAINIESKFPEIQKGFRDIVVEPLKKEYMGPEILSLTWIMLLITALILVISCANVANLLVARSIRRQREIAIRAALGATRKRILSQFLTESILLAFVGSLIGMALTLLDIRRIMNALVEMNAPYWLNFNLDWRVLLLVILVTVLTGILAGLVPALRAASLKESDILKDDSRTGSSLIVGRFSKSLVVLQISVAAVILTLVVLFIKSANNVLEVDYEYNPDEVISARMGLFSEVYPDEAARARFIQSLLARLQARPEISFASTTNRYQFFDGPGTRYEMPGRTYPDESEYDLATYQSVSPGFFATMQLPLLAGREFSPEEYTLEYPRQAIINRAFAEREWPDTNPVGKRFKPNLSRDGSGFEELPMLEVIGVVGSMNENGAMHDPGADGAGFYVAESPFTMPRFITIVARGPGLPHDLIPVIREEIASLDNNLPIYAIGTPRELNDQSTVQFRFFASVFRSFGIIATILAAVGIYGIITFSVNQRIIEFGIRKALGATHRTIFQLVYRHAFSQLLLGFLISLAFLSPVILSPGIRRSMALFFYEIDPDSIMPYLLSFGFVALVAIVAAAPPAFKAARIHPAKALRYE